MKERRKETPIEYWTRHKKQAEEALKEAKWNLSKLEISMFDKEPDVPSVGIVVDASCVGGRSSKAIDGYFHGVVEWQGVDIETGEFVIKSHVQQQSTINIGEYLAIVDGLNYLHTKGDSTTPIFSDSKICINWVNGRRTATNLPLNDLTRPALNELADAHEWLIKNDPKNPIYWWNHYRMGDNPADFHRKGNFKN